MKRTRSFWYRIVLVGWPLIAFASLAVSTISLYNSQLETYTLNARLFAQRALILSRDRRWELNPDRNILGLGAYDDSGKSIFSIGSAPLVSETKRIRFDGDIVRMTENLRDSEGFTGLPPSPEGPAALFIELRIPGLSVNLSRLRSRTGMSLSLIVLVLLAIEATVVWAIRTEQDVLRAEKRAGLADAARVLGHELRNSLAALKLNVRVAQVSGHPAADEDMRAVSAEVDRLTGLADRIGDFTRDPRGTPIPIDPTEIATEIGIDLGIQVYGSERSGKILADPGRFRVALQNLARNALESGSPLEEVRIEIQRIEDAMEIRFVDRGRGFPPELIKRGIQAFFTTKPSGMGIGLSISETYLAAAGGTLGISNRRGGGACTTVRMRAVKG